MPYIPCAIPPLPCESESPLANLSAENPDLRRFFKRSYRPDYVQVCESTVSDEAVAACNPPPPGSTVIYQSSQQTCVVACGEGSISYTVPAGAYMAITQEAADSQANGLACTIAASLCSNVPPATPGDSCTIECANGVVISFTASAEAAGGASACEIAELLCQLQELFNSVEQTCTVPCTNGGFSTFTFPAGSFVGITQAEADFNAYTFACLVASIACGTPPAPTGTDPDSSPIWVASKAVYCAISCGTGSTYYHFVPAGTFFRRTITQANQAAASYACSQAVTNKVCLGALPQFACVGSSVLQLISTTPSTEVTWSVIGELPPGLSFSDGLVMGLPTTTGTYAFAIRGVLANGSYSQRTYTVLIAEITTALLPNATEDSGYSQQLEQEGFSAPLVWSLIDGSLPDGVTLATDGEIAGTPTESGVFDFTARVTDDNGFYCEKAFVLEVEAASTTNPIEWWMLDEAANNPRIGSYAGVSMTEFGLAGISSVAGVVNNATRFNWEDQPVITGGLEVSTAVAELAYTTGSGLSLGCWVNTNPAELGGLFVQFQFADAGGGFDGLFRMWMDVFNSIIRIQLSDGVTGSSATITQAFVPSGSFQFFQFYLNPAGNLIGLRINNVDIATTPIVGAAVGSHPKGRMLVFASRTAGAPGSGSFDVCDLSIYPLVLSSTQSDYLYNSGAGQSWPAVLPP